MVLQAEVFIRICIWVAHRTSKNADFCLSQKRRACMSSRASGALWVPLISTSPVISCKTGSTSTSLQTIYNISASRSRSSLWRWMLKPPHLQTIAWSTAKSSPQTQTDGVLGISQSYLSLIPSAKFPLIQVEIHVLDGNNSQPTRCAFRYSKINSSLGPLG